MNEIMKREREMKRGDFFQKKVSRPSNPPDVLAQNVSKKIPFGRIIHPFFCKSAESGRFFIYLHDSNSIFWAQGIKSECFFGRTVRTVECREVQFRHFLVELLRQEEDIVLCTVTNGKKK